MTKVKICCIADEDEALKAIAHGADALGLVSSMPSGPGQISDELIAQIVRIIPSGVASFLLTCQQHAETVISQQRMSGVDTLQIVDRFPVAGYAILRSQLPGISIVQVIHVAGEISVDDARIIAPYVDALLLDSGNPSLATKQLGGTGRTHDWEISRRICESVATPVYLAGGLNPDNVTEAIRQVRPHGIDVCSGVRTNGQLDPLKLERFMRAVRQLP